MESRIQHLNGRDRLIAATGWPDDEAEWITLVCLHSGIFTRRQFEFHFSAGPSLSLRFVRKLTGLGLATEELLPTHEKSTTKACRISSKTFYRTIAIANIRYRRPAPPEVMYRRILALDYVLEHLDYPWMPTEPEKVTLTEGLGIETAILPQRLYRGAGRDSIRYFPLKLPIAFLPTKRQLVFVYVDPGNYTDTELRSWGDSHERFWNALRAQQYSIHVVGITSTIEESTRASVLLRRWTTEERQGGILGKARTAELKQELRYINQGLDAQLESVNEHYGGKINAIARSGEIKNILKNMAEHCPRINTYGIWNSRRIILRGGAN